MKRILTLFTILTIVSCTRLHAQDAVEQSWKILESGLTSQKAEQRVKAADALGLLAKNDRAREMAEAALNDPSPDVRAEAATTLGQIGLSASIPKLKDALTDKETEVVFAAAASLFQMNDAAGYSVYYAVLTGERKSGDKLLESQLKMLKDPKAVAKIGFEAGIGMVPFGGVGVKAIKSFRQDNVSPVRAAAAQKLAHDPDPKTSKALIDATSDEKWLVRASAISAISQRGDAALLSAIVPRLDDPEDTVRYTAAAAILRLNDIKSAQ